MPNQRPSGSIRAAGFTMPQRPSDRRISTCDSTAPSSALIRCPLSSIWTATNSTTASAKACTHSRAAEWSEVTLSTSALPPYL